MNEKYYVYVHQNTVNLKVYVGYSQQPERRWRMTKNAAYCINDEQYEEPLYKAIRREGWEKFTHQIIEEFSSKEEALEAEKFWIEWFRSNRRVYGTEYGYNLHEGGSCPPSWKGRTQSSEHKAKRLRYGRSVSAETRHRMSLSAKKRMRKKHSPETLHKMSLSALRRWNREHEREQNC